MSWQGKRLLASQEGSSCLCAEISELMTVHAGSQTTRATWRQILLELSLYCGCRKCFTDSVLFIKNWYKEFAHLTLRVLEWSVIFGKIVIGDLVIRLCIPIWPKNKTRMSLFEKPHATRPNTKIYQNADLHSPY